MNDLPLEYDTIIIGTGLTETIISSALARVGKTVLHIDKNDYYGCEYASFTLRNLIDYIKKNQETSTNNNNLSNLYDLNLKENFYKNSFEYKWNLENDAEIEIFLNKHNRKFVIDLNSNLFYSQSKLIDLLIQSDVSKYCEFKLIRRLLTCCTSTIDNLSLFKIEQIPTSRSDIFKSTNLTMIEKRLLMKFITSCLDESNNETELVETTFDSYLEKFNLTQRLRNYILNAISMSSSTVNINNGLNKCKKYFKSIGRYGDSPFLYQIYGTNELTQAFSRLSAVFGSIFYLNLDLCSIKLNEENNNLVDGVVVNLPNDKNKFFKCKNLITNLNYLNYEIDGDRYDISRCVLITNKSIFNNNEDESSQNNEISFLYLPESEKSPEIYIIESSSGAQVCPNGFYLVHMFCDKTNITPKQDFEEAINNLFPNEVQNENKTALKSNIIFEIYYSQLNTSKTKIKLNNLSNCYFPNTPTSNLDFDLNVNDAKEIFKKLYPNDEFLPKPPEPEDIIFGETTNEETK